MIKIQSFIFNSFQENTYILFDDTKECIIVDPGCYEKYEQKLLIDFVVKNKLNPVKLINTHCHLDHVLGNHFVAEKWKLELAMHELDVPTLKSGGKIGKNELILLGGYTFIDLFNNLRLTSFALILIRFSLSIK